MRICVIGSSHIAALKEADRKGWGRENGVELVFFGARFSLYQHLFVEDGILRGSEQNIENLRRISEGRDRIDPADFDGLVFHGADLRINHLVMSIVESNIGKKRLNFSRAFLREGMAAWVRGLMVYDQVSKLRQRGTPIVVSPSPNPTGSQYADSGLNELQLVELRQVADAVVEQAFGADGIPFVPQPAQTRGGGYYTREEFKTGAAKMTRTGDSYERASTEDDRFHMNSDYGALVLRDALAALSAKMTRPQPV